jgi:hypothetical protein
VVLRWSIAKFGGLLWCLEDLHSSISSLHAIEGAKNLPLTASMKLPGRPKGSTKANIVQEKKEKAFCKAEIANEYNKKMNEVRADGLTPVPREVI